MATKRRRTAAKRRGSQKRDLLKSKTATHFAKRGPRGRFTEMDESGRSLGADRRRTSKTKSRSGYGDRGDRAA